MRSLFRGRVVLGLGAAFAALLVSQAAVATAAPKPDPHKARFASASASFTDPNVVVSFAEERLEKNASVTYHLDGRNSLRYQCADGIWEDIPGPILPIRVTYTANKHGIIEGSLTATPKPAATFNGSAWVPFACNDGNPPVRVKNWFEGLAITDITNNVVVSIPGQYGYGS
jgi:hypothetical protein